jgi:hypothetical protein
VKAKLIFNPAAGNPTESAVQLVELLRHLQTQQIQLDFCSTLTTEYPSS